MATALRISEGDLSHRGQGSRRSIMEKKRNKSENPSH